MNKKFNQNLILILGIFILLIAGVLIYRSFFFKKILTQKEIEKTPEIPTPPEIPPPQPPPKIPIATKTKEPEETPYFDIDFSTSSDIKVEGVEIIYKKNTKLVINHKEGYQIEIPNDLILNRSFSADDLSFDSLDLIEKGWPPKYWSMIEIWVWQKESNPEAYNENYNLIKNPSIPKIIINGIEFAKVFHKDESVDEYGAYSYLTIKNGKIYEIYIISRELYEKYVKTFQFLR